MHSTTLDSHIVNRYVATVGGTSHTDKREGRRAQIHVVRTPPEISLLPCDAPDDASLLVPHLQSSNVRGTVHVVVEADASATCQRSTT